jgi:hypothetical protein
MEVAEQVQVSYDEDDAVQRLRDEGHTWRQWSETSSRGGDMTVLTLSTLVCVDRPYQDTLAYGMADVAEDSEWIQKHVLDCEQTMVMKALTRSLRMNHSLQKRLPIVSVLVRDAAEGIVESISGVARLNLPLFGYSHLPTVFGHEG